MKGTTSDGEDYCIAIAESNMQKDLSVLIDNKLSFKESNIQKDLSVLIDNKLSFKACIS